MSDCIFCKIVDGSIPSKKVYEDEKILAFYDLEPQAPFHVLVTISSRIASIGGLVTCAKSCLK